MRHARLSLVLLAAALSLGALDARAAPPSGSADGAVRELKWDDLVPKDWNPIEVLRKRKPTLLDDSLQGMAAMREVWDNAPTVPALEGVRAKLAGYVVPLESTPDALREFLLVPYFGACIHMPPPPANQIVHVVTANPAKGVKAMDVVWVSGTMRQKRQDDAFMGVSGYRIEGASIEPYTGKR